MTLPIAVPAHTVLAPEPLQAAEVEQPAVEAPPATVQPAPVQEAPLAPPAGPPQPPTSSEVVGVAFPGLGIEALSRSEVQAIEKRGGELSDQLRSAAGRRSNLLKELEKAESPIVRAGIEQRISVLDERLVELEKSIADNGRLKSSLPANLRTSSQSEDPTVVVTQPSLGPITPGIAFLLLAPLAIAATRMLWRRGSRAQTAPISPQAQARMEQLEQAIDTVAVEIERVSEGQRYLTKLLRDGQPIPDFVSGRASNAEPVELRRSDG